MKLVHIVINIITVLMITLLVACGGGGGGGGGGTGGDASDVYIVADPEQVQQVATGSYVMLDASNSTEKTGNEIHYNWIIFNAPTGSIATLDESEKSVVNPSFIPDKDGKYQFTLEISTNSGGEKVTSTQTVEVVASSGNVKPMANPGPSFEARANTSVQLDASFSLDADGDELNYSWRIAKTPAGGVAQLSDPNGEKPTLAVDKAGDYEVELIVNDGDKDSEPTILVITVIEGNARPIAVAGYDIYAQKNSTVTLNGGLSRDAESENLTYSWFFASKPAISSTRINNSTSVKPEFVPDVEGAYVISLRVNDGQQRIDNNNKRTSDIDNVLVLVTKGDNLPVANAGLDRNVETDVAVIVNGVFSYDPDGDQLAYNWSLVQQPDTSASSLTNADKVRASFKPDVAGEYIVQLIVNDGSNDSQEDTLTINVTSPNHKPVANPGSYNPVAINTLVQLDGSASTDEDGDNLTYSWSISKPEGSVADLSAGDVDNPTFTPDVTGNYQISLSVNDGEIHSELVSVSITVFLPNQTPIANAGTDQANVTLGDTVTLNGSESSDNDGDEFTYLWSFVSGPEDVTALISDVTAVTPSFKPLVAGVYELALVVNDSKNNSEPNTVVITVIATNHPPIANAGPDQENILVNAEVQLSASNSSDEDGNDLTFLWSFVSAKDLSNVEIDTSGLLSDSAIENPTFMPFSAGVYELALIVNDSKVDSIADQVVITVMKDITTITPPVVTIVSPLEETTNASGTMVTFIGTATDTEDGDLSGDALVWSSSIDGVLNTTGESITALLSDGRHIITLTATNSDGLTASIQICLGIGISCNVILNEDFESGWGNWFPDSGVWQIGTPSAGPVACYSGAQCAGTQLDGNYDRWQDSRLINQSKIELPSDSASAAKIQLRFWHWYSYSTYDYGQTQLQVWDETLQSWGGWTAIGNSFTGISQGWVPMIIDVREYAGKTIRLGFYHFANSNCGSCANESSGWYVDDINIEVQTTSFTGDFESGWADWSPNLGVWQIGEATAGPGACYSGIQCAGTQLDGNYNRWQVSYLIGADMEVPTPGASETLQLRFWHWYSYSTYDYGQVNVKVWDEVLQSWGDWIAIGNSFTGVSQGWAPMIIDVSEYSGKTVRLGFYHFANSNCGSCANESSGWYVDDIQLIVQ